jgi:hypothetical protein
MIKFVDLEYTYLDLDVVQNTQYLNMIFWTFVGLIVGYMSNIVFNFF